MSDMQIQDKSGGAKCPHQALKGATHRRAINQEKTTGYNLGNNFLLCLQLLGISNWRISMPFTTYNYDITF